MDITQYYFNGEIWTNPEIVDSEGNIIDTLNVCENMYSWFVMHGKVYLAYEESHYGAIIAGLLNTHHLDTVEQLERKFKQSIDSLCEEIRYSKQNEGEGRFWCKYNIIEWCGSNRPDIAKYLTDGYVQQICQQVGTSENNVYVLGEHQEGTPMDYSPIVPYKEYTQGMINENLILEEETVGGLDNVTKFTPDVQWMSKMYQKANEELFNGSLGDCVFRAEPITSHSRWLGMFSFGAQVQADRRTRRLEVVNPFSFNREPTYVNYENFYDVCRPIITLNTMYRGTELSLYCTLVHEMCHYYTYMRGYCPKQAHGPEFRDIGRIVSYRSGNLFTIQRLANAEQMEGYEVTPEVQAKRDRQLANKKLAAHYYIILRADGEVRLLNPTRQILIDIRTIEHGNRLTEKMLEVTDPEITAKLFDEGYKKKQRVYRFWTSRAGITKQNPIIQEILNNPNTYKIVFENE